MENRFAEVIVDVAHSSVDKIFDYRLPPGLAPVVGGRVSVPFGNTKAEAILLRVKQKTDVPAEKLKEVLKVIDDVPVVNAEQLRLAEYMCAKYKTTMAFALRLMYPASMRGGRVGQKSLRYVKLREGTDAAALKQACYTKEGLVRAKNRLAVIEALENDPKGVAASLLDPASVKFLEKNGYAEVFARRQYRTPYKDLEPEKKDFELNEDQKNAVEALSASIAAGRKDTFLLHGVTGSGKTAVYIEAVRFALEQGKSASVLVPEISLTPQMMGEFAVHFGEKVAVFHSALSAGERFDEWNRVREQEAKIVLGARSAVFMPLQNIGLIVIDEEHSESYRAENHPAYHAQEIANIRCRLSGAALLLASATPLIEDYAKAEMGIYKLLRLPKRIGDLPLPRIHIVDMKQEFMRGNRSAVSALLFARLKETRLRHEQALIFLNRRGYSSSIVCPMCGHVMMCSHCDVPVKFHKDRDKLLCHHCARQFEVPSACPECGSAFLKYAGTGTQKICEELQELLPAARILRLDMDAVAGKKDAHQKLFDQFKNGEADILVGTQMIAKGLDFPGVTLSAILSADATLYFGDYRQEENTFSMIEQVGGRSGRKKQGSVIVQTYNPEHYAIRFAAAHDYEGFYKTEIAYRKATWKPPFSRIFRLLFIHENEEKARTACEHAEKDLKALLKPYQSDILLFVAKAAPVSKLQGKMRYHIIVKTRVNRTTAAVREAVARVWEEYNRKILVSMETDPYDIN